MTVRERVLAERLIQKIDNNDSYAKQIGLSYTVESREDKNQSVRKENRTI